MGVNLECDVYLFRISYSGWNNIRCIIVEATIKYLEFINKHDTKDNYEDESEYQYFKDSLQDFLNKMNEINNHCVDKEYNTMKEKFINIAKEELKIMIGFNSIIENNNSYLDTLIRYGVGGLYSLCYKSDCQGFYSSGNSLDICKLFDKIKPFLKVIDENIYNYIYDLNDLTIYYPNYKYEGLYKLFENSWIHDIIVTIS